MTMTVMVQKKTKIHDHLQHLLVSFNVLDAVLAIAESFKWIIPTQSSDESNWCATDPFGKLQEVNSLQDLVVCFHGIFGIKWRTVKNIILLTPCVFTPLG